MCSWVCPDIYKNRGTLVKRECEKRINGKEVRFAN